MEQTTCEWRAVRTCNYATFWKPSCMDGHLMNIQTYSKKDIEEIKCPFCNRRTEVFLINPAEKPIKPPSYI